jgi:hypothetical protein
VNVVMNLQVLYNIRKFLSSCTTGSFSRRAYLHGVGYLEYTGQHLFFNLHRWGCLLKKLAQIITLRITGFLLNAIHFFFLDSIVLFMYRLQD